MNVEGKDTGLDESLPVSTSFVDRWLLGRLQVAKRDIADNLVAYRFDLAAKALYEFAWDEFCDWYVELAKVQMQRADAGGDAAAARGTRRTLVRELEALLRLAHPFIPFITEELWQSIAPLAGKRGESISVQPFPQANFERVDATADADMALLKDVINACRTLRSEMKLSPAQKVPLVATGNAPRLTAFAPYVAALARLSDVQIVDELPPTDAPVQIVGEFRLMLKIEVDAAAEELRISREIARIEPEVANLKSKLANEGFVARAPANIVAQERARLVTLEATMAKLKDQSSRLSR